MIQYHIERCAGVSNYDSETFNLIGVDETFREVSEEVFDTEEEASAALRLKGGNDAG